MKVQCTTKKGGSEILRIDANAVRLPAKAA